MNPSFLFALGLQFGLILAAVTNGKSTGNTLPPTPGTRFYDTTPRSTVRSTFPTPHEIWTAPSLDCRDCGVCGLCSDLSETGCVCFEGCSFNRSIRSCEDHDECSSSPCKNGGVCVNEVGSYRCQGCSRGFAGRQCEKQYDGKQRPQVTSVSPTRGILAGGGKLEITGKNFDLFPPVKVSFRLSEGGRGDILAGMDRKNMTSESVFVITPRGKSDFVKKQYNIVVTFSSETVELNRTFVYTDNPTVSGISPSNPFVSSNGGAGLTITGTDLDSPSVTILVSELEISNRTVIVFESNGTSTCKPHNETVLHCPMPDFGIPRNASWQTDVKTEDLVNTMTVTLVHDVYKSKDPQRVNPKMLRVIGSSEPEYYDPERGESLKIQVENVDVSTASLRDFTVEIGDKNCTVTKMLTNLLECAPPRSTPSAARTSVERCQSHGLAVLVKVPGETHFAKCVHYHSGRLPMIIGLSVAGALLLLALVAIVYALVIRKGCPKSPFSGDTSRVLAAYNDFGRDDSLPRKPRLPPRIILPRGISLPRGINHPGKSSLYSVFPEVARRGADSEEAVNEVGRGFRGLEIVGRWAVKTLYGNEVVELQDLPRGATTDTGLNIREEEGTMDYRRSNALAGRSNGANSNGDYLVV